MKEGIENLLLFALIFVVLIVFCCVGGCLVDKSRQSINNEVQEFDSVCKECESASVSWIKNETL